MKIYLIRHSESIDDIEDCYGGIADFDLTKNGRDKVREYSTNVKEFKIEKIYTSPYKRAYQTAQILNEVIQVELEVVEDIRELNSYGILSGINKTLAKDIFSHVFQKEEYKNTGYYLGSTFLGGENVEEFDIRVKDAISYIIKQSKGLDTIAIVTHGGVYRSIYKNILKIDKKIETIEDLATTQIEFDGKEFTLISVKGVKLGGIF